MICNVIDHRTNRYDVNVDVVFEPSQHDNSIAGASQFTWGQEAFSCEALSNITIVRAIEYANERWDCPVTLFLYDRGGTDIVYSDSLG